ncbi:MAG TPA: zinc ribbon domain-containing protein [Desulfitobacteriaceae bacterium]|nr:zinc ribbon domain-containing protein [Desulfitobacteriaceae bacterium]
MDLIDKLSSFAKDAIDKTSELLDITGLKAKITAEETKISISKGKIGEHYWEKFQAGAELDEEAAALCTEIKNSLTTIEGYKAEIEKIKAGQEKNPGAANVCPSCGQPVTEGVKFCSECGAKIE